MHELGDISDHVWPHLETPARVENTTCHAVLLMNFEGFENMVKHCLESSQSKLKPRRKWNKILKLYAH